MKDGLGFLINDIARLFRRELTRRIRPMGITALQWRTLASIDRYDGIIQSHLAELLEVEPITLSRMIDRLAEAELVTRHACPEDRRANRLSLTPKATPLVAKVRALAEQMLTDAQAGLDADQVNQFARMLEIVRGNLSNRADSDNRETEHKNGMEI